MCDVAKVISSTVSCASPAARFLPASFDSDSESPVTSLSNTNRTAELQLMALPIIPLPDTINVQTDPVLLLQLTQAYRE